MGIPTYTQTLTNFDELPKAQAENFDLRGRTGVSAVWDWLCEEGDGWLGDANRTVVNWHVHNSLLDFMPDFIKKAGNVSVITCYPELLGVLHKHFGVKKGQDYLIPPQAMNIKGTPEEYHYPERFHAIMNQLKEADHKGKLFLVGAGLLGKAYCDAIRQAGGMAIDVGSMMDVWMGKGVRQYQNEEYLNNRKLVTTEANSLFK